MVFRDGWDLRVGSLAEIDGLIKYPTLAILNPQIKVCQSKSFTPEFVIAIRIPVLVGELHQGISSFGDHGHIDCEVVVRTSHFRLSDIRVLIGSTNIEAIKTVIHPRGQWNPQLKTSKIDAARIILNTAFEIKVQCCVTMPKPLGDHKTFVTSEEFPTEQFCGRIESEDFNHH